MQCSGQIFAVQGRKMKCREAKCIADNRELQFREGGMQCSKYRFQVQRRRIAVKLIN